MSRISQTHVCVFYFDKPKAIPRALFGLPSASLRNTPEPESPSLKKGTLLLWMIKQFLNHIPLISKDMVFWDNNPIVIFVEIPFLETNVLCLISTSSSFTICKTGSS